MPENATYLALLRRRAADLPFFRLIGLEVVDIRPGRSVLTIRHRPDLAQPAGLMHGGVIASLIDTGIAYAILARDEVRTLVTGGGSVVAIELRIKYFRPVADGVLTCVSTVTRLGRRIMHGDSIVTGEDGREVARGDAIYGPAASRAPADRRDRPGRSGSDAGGSA